MNEIPPAILFWIKTAAGALAVLTAYGAKGDWLRRILAKFTPRKVQERLSQSNMDVAWRELMDDSIKRDCTDSVELLNAWMSCRTNSQLTTGKAVK